MPIKNSIYYLILFLFSFAFVMSYHVYQELQYREEVRSRVVFNPIIDINHYNRFENNKYIKEEDESLILTDSDPVYSNSDLINELLIGEMSDYINIFNENDFCILEIKNSKLNIIDCTNQIMKLKVEEKIDYIKENNQLYKEKNKKIKFYFK